MYAQRTDKAFSMRSTVDSHTIAVQVDAILKIIIGRCELYIVRLILVKKRNYN